MFNLPTDLQSLEILFLSHTLSKSSLLQFIKKLVTRHICLPNSKLFTQISKMLCNQIQKGFTKVESSIWQQTSNHLKYYSYHICYPKFSLPYLIKKLATRCICKSIKSCATESERVCEISLRFQIPKIIPTPFHSFKNTTII